MTIRPIGSIGWRTVVSGGSMEFIRAESSKPTTETSAGTCIPARRTARIAPSASGSDAQITAVTPAASSRAAAAWPASRRVVRVRHLLGGKRHPGRLGDPLSRGQLALRGDVVGGPEDEPDPSVCPSCTRWFQRLLDGHGVIGGDGGEPRAPRPAH